MSNTIKLSFKGEDDLGKKLTTLFDLDDHIEQELGWAVSEAMRKQAVVLLTDQLAKDSGDLVKSIETTEADFVEREGATSVSMGIKTNVDYAIFVEYGTGPKGDPAIPHTSKRIWFQHNPEYDALYPDDDPRSQAWIPRFPQKPRKFMRPALYDNVEAYKAILSEGITNIFEEA